MSHQVEEKMQKAYAYVGGETKAIPWPMILQMILSLLGGCSTKRAKAYARRHPEVIETMLRDKLKDESNLSSKDVKLVAKAGIKVFNSMTSEEVDHVING